MNTVFKKSLLVITMIFGLSAVVSTPAEINWSRLTDKFFSCIVRYKGIATLTTLAGIVGGYFAWKNWHNKATNVSEIQPQFSSSTQSPSDDLSFRLGNSNDRQTLERMFADQEAQEWFFTDGDPVKGAADLVDDMCKQTLYGKNYRVICINNGATVVGIIYLAQNPDDAECSLIGYVIDKPFRGNGLATKAVKAMVNVGFSKCNFKRITAEVLSGNEASKQVLLKCGFKAPGSYPMGDSSDRSPGRFSITKEKEAFEQRAANACL